MSIFKDAQLVAHGVNPRTYHVPQPYKRGEAQYVMSRSELVSFAECPAKWIKAGLEQEQTRFTRWGGILDCLLTCPQHFNANFVLTPETYISEAKKGAGEEKPWTLHSPTCRDWVTAKENEGFTVVAPATLQYARAAEKAFNEVREFAEIFDNSLKQVHVQGNFEANGVSVPVRALLDVVPSPKGKFADFLADIKSTSYARYHEWRRNVYNDNLDVQAALYLDLFNSTGQEPRHIFAHLIQEIESPYQTAQRILSEEFLECGRRKYLAALKYYTLCLSRNNWPGFDDENVLGNQPIRKWNGWALIEPEPWMVA